MEAKMRGEFPHRVIEGTHTCGYPITILEVPELYDVTTGSDVPLALKGVPLSQLPEIYHKYIQVGKTVLWRVDGQGPVKTCPGCHAELSKETVTKTSVTSDTERLQTSHEVICDACKQPMKRLGNVSGMTYMSNPPQEDIVYICEQDKTKKTIRESGYVFSFPDLRGYKEMK